MKLPNNRFIDLTKLNVMGILNVTQDSFSDGNKYFCLDKAIEHAFRLIDEGADLIDIGGESTRPGALPVSEAEEIDRVMPIIESLRKDIDVPISIDTYKPKVALYAIKAGADIVNDITSLSYGSDLSMTEVLIQFPDIPVILMHMQGTPQTMQQNPIYDNVISDIQNYFRDRISYCQTNKIDLNRIILDPGIGFGKSFLHNIEIIKNIDKFQDLSPEYKQQFPVLLGTSRKSFINLIYSSKPDERLVGSLASTVSAFIHKIQFIRVHDVKEHKQMIKSLEWML